MSGKWQDYDRLAREFAQNKMLPEPHVKQRQLKWQPDKRYAMNDEEDDTFEEEADDTMEKHKFVIAAPIALQPPTGIGKKREQFYQAGNHGSTLYKMHLRYILN